MRKEKKNLTCVFCDCKNSPLQGVDFTVCLQRAPLASQLQSLGLGEVSGVSFFFSSLFFFSLSHCVLHFKNFSGLVKKCLLVLSVLLSVSSNNYPRPASFQNLIKICFEIQRQSLSLTHTRVATVFLCQLFSVGNELAAGDGASLIEVICAQWFLGVVFFGLLLVTASTDQ